jgi:hypothetical protein
MKMVTGGNVGTYVWTELVTYPIAMATKTVTSTSKVTVTAKLKPPAPVKKPAKP